MDELMSFVDINGNLEVFSKCFINLKNLSDDMFTSFKCTVWNHPPQSMPNNACWKFDFFDETPFKAMEKAFKFVIKNKDCGFIMNYDECMKLRNYISKLDS